MNEVIKPDGDRIDINRFFKENGNDAKENWIT